MEVNDIQWYAKHEPEIEEVKVELTTPLSSDITCHDLYFMMITEFKNYMEGKK